MSWCTATILARKAITTPSPTPSTNTPAPASGQPIANSTPQAATASSSPSSSPGSGSSPHQTSFSLNNPFTSSAAALLAHSPVNTDAPAAMSAATSAVDPQRPPSPTSNDLSAIAAARFAARQATSSSTSSSNAPHDHSWSGRKPSPPHSPAMVPTSSSPTLKAKTHRLGLLRGALSRATPNASVPTAMLWGTPSIVGSTSRAQRALYTRKLWTAAFTGAAVGVLSASGAALTLARLRAQQTNVNTTATGGNSSAAIATAAASSASEAVGVGAGVLESLITKWTANPNPNATAVDGMASFDVAPVLFPGKQHDDTNATSSAWPKVQLFDGREAIRGAVAASCDNWLSYPFKAYAVTLMFPNAVSLVSLIRARQLPFYAVWWGSARYGLSYIPVQFGVGGTAGALEAHIRHATKTSPSSYMPELASTVIAGTLCSPWTTAFENLDAKRLYEQTGGAGGTRTKPTALIPAVRQCVAAFGMRGLFAGLGCTMVRESVWATSWRHGTEVTSQMLRGTAVGAKFQNNPWLERAIAWPLVAAAGVTLTQPFQFVATRQQVVTTNNPQDLAYRSIWRGIQHTARQDNTTTWRVMTRGMGGRFWFYLGGIAICRMVSDNAALAQWAKAGSTPALIQPKEEHNKKQSTLKLFN